MWSPSDSLSKVWAARLRQQWADRWMPWVDGPRFEWVLETLEKSGRLGGLGYLCEEELALQGPWATRRRS
jgi:hypothetical protein